MNWKDYMDREKAKKVGTLKNGVNYKDYLWGAEQRAEIEKAAAEKYKPKDPLEEQARAAKVKEEVDNMFASSTFKQRQADTAAKMKQAEVDKKKIPFLSDLAGGLLRAGNSLMQVKASTDAKKNQEFAKINKKLGLEPEAPINKLLKTTDAEVEAGFKKNREFIDKHFSTVNENDGTITKLAKGVAGSLPEMALYAVPGVGQGLGALASYGSAYGAAVDNGVKNKEMYAAKQAAIDTIAMPQILKGKGKLFKDIGTSTGEAALQGLASETTDKLFKDSEGNRLGAKTWGEFAGNVAQQTATGTILGTGAHLTHKITNKIAAKNPATDVIKADAPEESTEVTGFNPRMLNKDNLVRPVGLSGKMPGDNTIPTIPKPISDSYGPNQNFTYQDNTHFKSATIKNKALEQVYAEYDNAIAAIQNETGHFKLSDDEILAAQDKLGIDLFDIVDRMKVLESEQINYANKDQLRLKAMMGLSEPKDLTRLANLQEGVGLRQYAPGPEPKNLVNENNFDLPKENVIAPAPEAAPQAPARKYQTFKQGLAENLTRPTMKPVKVEKPLSQSFINAVNMTRPEGLTPVAKHEGNKTTDFRNYNNATLKNAELDRAYAEYDNAIAAIQNVVGHNKLTDSEILDVQDQLGINLFDIVDKIGKLENEGINYAGKDQLHWEGVTGLKNAPNKITRLANLREGKSNLKNYGPQAEAKNLVNANDFTLPQEPVATKHNPDRTIKAAPKKEVKPQVINKIPEIFKAPFENKAPDVVTPQEAQYEPKKFNSVKFGRKLLSENVTRPTMKLHKEDTSFNVKPFSDPLRDRRNNFKDKLTRTNMNILDNTGKEYTTVQGNKANTIVKKDHKITVMEDNKKTKYQAPGTNATIKLVDRILSKVGRLTSTYSISHDYPELKPFIQQEAQSILREYNSKNVKGERHVRESQFIGDKTTTGTKHMGDPTFDAIRAMLAKTVKNGEATYAKVEAHLRNIANGTVEPGDTQAKKIELFIHDNLINGSDTMEAYSIPANKEYRAIVDKINKLETPAVNDELEQMALQKEKEATKGQLDLLMNKGKNKKAPTTKKEMTLEEAKARGLVAEPKKAPGIPELDTDIKEIPKELLNIESPKVEKGYVNVDEVKNKIPKLPEVDFNSLTESGKTLINGVIRNYDEQIKSKIELFSRNGKIQNNNMEGISSFINKQYEQAVKSIKALEKSHNEEAFKKRVKEQEEADAKEAAYQAKVEAKKKPGIKVNNKPKKEAKTKSNIIADGKDIQLVNPEWDKQDFLKSEYKNEINGQKLSKEAKKSIDNELIRHIDRMENLLKIEYDDNVTNKAENAMYNYAKIGVNKHSDTIELEHYYVESGKIKEGYTSINPKTGEVSGPYPRNNSYGENWEYTPILQAKDTSKSKIVSMADNAKKPENWVETHNGQWILVDKTTKFKSKSYYAVVNDSSGVLGETIYGGTPQVVKNKVDKYIKDFEVKSNDIGDMQKPGKVKDGPMSIGAALRPGAEVPKRSRDSRKPAIFLPPTKIEPIPKDARVRTSKYKTNSTEYASFLQGKDTRDSLAEWSGEYGVKTNEDTLQRATEMLNKDYIGTVDNIIKKGINTAEDTAAGMLVTKNFADKGQYENLKSWVSIIRKNATDLGQAVQAFSMYKKLTPEGTLIKAQNVVEGVQQEIEKADPALSKKVYSEIDNFIKEFAKKSGVTPKTMTEIMKILNAHAESAAATGNYSLDATKKALKVAEAMIKQFKGTDKVKFEDVAKVEVSLEKGIEKIYKKYQIPYLSKEDVKYIVTRAKEIQDMPEGDEKDFQFALLKKFVAEKKPPTFLEKVKSYQRINLLLNLKTNARNIGGNVVIGGLEGIKDLPTTLIDKAISKKTGNRTTYTADKDTAKTYKDSAKTALKTTIRDTKAGVDTSKFQGRYDLPKTQALRGEGGAVSKFFHNAEKINNGLLMGGDRIFTEGYYNESIRQLKKKNPKMSDDVIEALAEHIAKDKTFQNDSNLAEGFKKLQQGMNKMLNYKGFGLGDLVIPFTKTPANILEKAIDYTPVGGAVGIGKLVYAMKKGTINNPITQKQIVDKLGRGLTGTALIGLGALLAHLGVLKGKAPSNSEAAQLEKQSGILPYSIRWGKTYTTIDWAQPAAVPLMVGADAYSSKSIADGALSGASTLLNQSLLSGIARMFSSYESDPGKKILLGVFTAATNGVQQIVPLGSALKQGAQLIDTKARTQDNPLQQMGAKIPGVSMLLPEKVDTQGNTVKNFYKKDTAVGNALYPLDDLINPGYHSKYNPTKAAKLALDMYEKTGETRQMPRKADSSITYLDTKGKKQKVGLSSKEINELQKYMGQATEKEFARLGSGGDPQDKVEQMYQIIQKIERESKEKLIKQKRLSYKKVYNGN